MIGRRLFTDGITRRQSWCRRWRSGRGTVGNLLLGLVLSVAIVLGIIGDLMSDAILGGGNDNGAANDP